MSVRLRILNGTPTFHTTGHLCQSCYHSFHRVVNNKDEYACAVSPIRDDIICGRVTQCRLYQSTLDQQAMRFFHGQAWHLNLNDKGKLEYRTPADLAAENAPRTRSGRRRNKNRVVVTVRQARKRNAPPTPATNPVVQ